MAILSFEKAAKALRTHRGVILKAAQACEVDRSTFYKFMEKYPELKDIRNECDEELLDVAEANVISAIDDKDMKTTRWYLERKGKERGYVTRQEQTGADGEPLQFQAIERTVVRPSPVDDVPPKKSK